MLTINEIKDVVPSNLRTSVTQELVDEINNIAKDPEKAEIIRDNFVTYSRILSEGKYKMGDYLNAVTYVSYKIMGYNNVTSYARTFPDRYARLKAKNATQKDISAYVSAYNKNQLVNKVLEQTLIPDHILHHDYKFKAIKVLMEIATDDSEGSHNRVKAADSLLTHLKKPENNPLASVTLNVETNSNLVNDLSKSLDSLVRKQQELIEKGVTAKDVAATKIIEGEYVES